MQLLNGYIKKFKVEKLKSLKKSTIDLINPKANIIQQIPKEKSKRHKNYHL